MYEFQNYSIEDYFEVVINYLNWDAKILFMFLASGL